MDSKVMDQIKHCEEISSLVKLADEYERQLKMVGIDLSDMPEDCISLVNKYAEVKSKTNLHDLSASFLDEYYCMKMKEHIEHSHNKSRLGNDIKSLEDDIEQEMQMNKSLEEFLESVKTRIVTEDEMEKTKFMIEKQIDTLLTKHEKVFRLLKDFSLDHLIAKVDMLQAKRKQSK